MFTDATIRFTLSDIEYEGKVPDIVACKHIVQPVQSALVAKREIPEGAQRSLASAALGLVFASAARVLDGAVQEAPRRPPAFGSLRDHGWDPYAFGDAVERHFVEKQRVPYTDLLVAADRCFRAVMGLPIRDDEVEEAVGNSQGTPSSGSGSDSGSSTPETPPSTSRRRGGKRTAGR